MSVKTVYGEVEADFSKVSQQGSISINAVYGLVDVSLPSNTKANLELKSTMGTVFTNFDFKIPSSKGLKQYGNSRKIDTKLNNGGVKISLSSSTGNVYLRKK